MKKNKIKLVMFWLILTGLVACEGFLDEKPEDSVVVISTLQDVRSLLDNSSVFNRQGNLVSRASDEFVAPEHVLANLFVAERRSYLWLDDPFQGEMVSDWVFPYEQVFYANVALEALDRIEEISEEKSQLRGEALFHRTYAYFNLLQQFAPAYQLNGNQTGLKGIVLKQSADINEPAVRSDLETCYTLIKSDLQEAVSLLPDFSPYKTRPIKAAAWGLLARVCLVTGDYLSAAQAASSALDSYNPRLDLNQIDVNVRFPFPQFNDEMIFYSLLRSSTFNISNEVFVSEQIQQVLEDGDLRIEAFFDETSDGNLIYTGKFSGNTAFFGGLSVGELELTAAEAYARIGNEESALSYLNGFLRRRISESVFSPVEATGQELMHLILDQRKLELIGRGTRWFDLRRLNQEPEYQTIFTRGEGSVVILPDSPKYVFPIPDLEVALTGIEQNER